MTSILAHHDCPIGTLPHHFIALRLDIPCLFRPWHRCSAPRLGGCLHERIATMHFDSRIIFEPGSDSKLFGYDVSPCNTTRDWSLLLHDLRAILNVASAFTISHHSLHIFCEATPQENRTASFPQLHVASPASREEGPLAQAQNVMTRLAS